MRQLIFAGAVAALVAVIAWRAMRARRAGTDAFLIYPYLDLAEDGYRGNPYPLSEPPPLSETFAGPRNPALYDYPYRYPRHHRFDWDADRRCRANCGSGGCTVWCR